MKRTNSHETEYDKYFDKIFSVESKTILNDLNKRIFKLGYYRICDGNYKKVQIDISDLTEFAYKHLNNNNELEFMNTSDEKVLKERNELLKKRVAILESELSDTQLQNTVLETKNTNLKLELSEKETEVERLSNLLDKYENIIGWFNLQLLPIFNQTCNNTLQYYSNFKKTFIKHKYFNEYSLLALEKWDSYINKIKGEYESLIHAWIKLFNEYSTEAFSDEIVVSIINVVYMIALVTNSVAYACSNMTLLRLVYISTENAKKEKVMTSLLEQGLKIAKLMEDLYRKKKLDNEESISALGLTYLVNEDIESETKLPILTLHKDYNYPFKSV